MSYSGSSNNLPEDRRLHQSRSQALLVSLGKASNKLQGLNGWEKGANHRDVPLVSSAVKQLYLFRK
jgi:hypothetical protein